MRRFANVLKCSTLLALLAFTGCQTTGVKEATVAKPLAPMEKIEVWTVGSTYVSQNTESKEIYKSEVIARDGLIVTRKSENGCITIKDYSDFFSQNIRWENCSGANGTNTITKLDDYQVWPLKVGNNWKTRYQGGNEEGREWETVRACEVESEAKVTTQLGEFDTFKVVCEDTWDVYTWYMAPAYKMSVLYTRYRKNRNSLTTLETVNFTLK